MKNSDNQKYYAILIGLNQDNVSSIYQRQFNYWRLFCSENVIYNGNRLDRDEIHIMVMGGLQVIDMEKQGFQVDDQNDGFPLLEKNFIEEEISTYTEIHRDTFGDPLNRITRLRTDIYLKYLKERLQGISETKTQQKDPSLSATDIAYLQYYMRKSRDYKDGEKTWTEIHQHFSEMNGGKSPKNIELAYNKIRSDEKERKSNPDKITKIIAHLKKNFSQYTKSIELAESELNQQN